MREIEFKALYKDAEGINKWAIGGYIGNNGNPRIIDADYNFSNVDEETVCQLITTINDIKLYENDCYFDRDYPEYIVLFCYNSNGILLKKDIHLTRFVEVGIGIIKYADNNDLNKTTKLKYVGNWHDGTETILKEIKELQK